MIYAKVEGKKLKQIEEQLKGTKNAKWYCRLKIIQLSSQGRTVPELAKDFDLCQATVRVYINQYKEGGLEALKPGYSPGSPAKIKLNKEQWEQLLHQSPSQFEKLNTGARNWTQEFLVKYCSIYLGVNLSQSTICTIFKRLRISYNRGKLKVTSPDPLYTIKRERVETLKKKQ